MKPHAAAYNQRLLKGQAPSYERLQARLAEDGSPQSPDPIAVHCGWGRLLIGHTFADPSSLALELLNEQAGERDIALVRGARARALLRGGEFVTPDDIKGCALAVLRHRVRIAPELDIDGLEVDQVLQHLLDQIAAPRQ